MTKVKVKWYPYVSAYVRKAGLEVHYRIQAYQMTDSFNEEHGLATIALPPIELLLEVPDEKQVERAVIDLMHQCRDKLRAEHVAKLTKMQILENILLRIEAPDEILDAVDKPAGHKDNDIPF